MAESEAFLDAVAAGMRIAARSRQEKRKLLRNAALNTALGMDLDEDRHHVFFDLIDRLPPASFRLLKFLADPRYREDVIGYEPPRPSPVLVPIADIAQLLSPTSTPGERDGNVLVFLDIQCQRLKGEALLDLSALTEAGYDKENEYFAHYVMLDKVTRFGRAFLAFIEDPTDDDASAG
ncbi:hypothetical protein KBX50_25670 [Micromonospora sp. C51]|uniref:hypothetical protein n=1 Tax=Micromonospora sp. C51 TaxID=2824879 RepID=UPI001B37AC34|nr:hypothetical protein [Micromonospora sp. C51]MBQ1051838.1 hypothetical protein [Micromonospora sp. C51]